MRGENRKEDNGKREERNRNRNKVNETKSKN